MVPAIREVFIRNYKSIAQARASLEPLTALVGPNGSGKSNFVDSLAFVQECLSNSIELALRNRGGISEVRRRSGGHPGHIEIRLDIALAEVLTAHYAFELAPRPGERFAVAREQCALDPPVGRSTGFEVRSGEFVREIPGIRPRLAPDRLALFAASDTEEFRPLYDFLASMRSYAIAPSQLRELQAPDSGAFLRRDGSNAAAVLRRLKERADGTDTYARICRLLSVVVDGLESVQSCSLGRKETLEFTQNAGLRHPWRFGPSNMSDGTLRVLGLLLALYQPGSPSVVIIEEPEATVHPAVSEVVFEVLQDASRERQVLFTTHSADILDHKELRDTQIRVVTAEQSRTLICPLSASSRQAVRERLYTAGELLRCGELAPDMAAGKSGAE